MRRSQERPLSGHFLETSQQETAESACLLDLTEDRFNGLFSQSVSTAPSPLAQLRPHGLASRALARFLVARRRGRAVLLPSRGDVGLETSIVVGAPARTFLVEMSSIEGGMRPP